MMFLASSLIGFAYHVAAVDVVSYKYDAIGRLVEVCNKTTNKKTTYEYDKADNRKHVRVEYFTGCPAAVSAHGVAASDGASLPPLIINSAPVPVNDTVTGSFLIGTPVVVSPLLNDTDADGDSLSITSASCGSGCSVTVVGNDLEVNSTTGGVVTVNYTVSDGNGGSSSATVTVNSYYVNSAPSANNDTVTGTFPVGTPVVVSPLSNDTDVDGDSLSVTSASCGSGCSVAVVGKDLEINSTIGGLATVSYIVSDGNGGSSSATVTVNSFVEPVPVNSAPVAVNDTVTGAFEIGPSLDIRPLGNDTDADNDTLTITDATCNGPCIISHTSTTISVATLLADTMTINYTISDGNGGTDSAVITINQFVALPIGICGPLCI